MKRKPLELAPLPHPEVNDIAVFDGREWVTRPLPTRDATIIHKTTLQRMIGLGHPGGSGYALVSGDSSIDWDLTPTWEGTHLWDGTYGITLRDAALTIYSSTDGQLDIDADVEVELTSTFFDIRADIRTDRWLNSDTNVFIGVDVVGGDALTHASGDQGYDNVVIGYYAGYTMTSANNNVIIGYEAASHITTATMNVFVGMRAGHTATTSSFNTCVGWCAGELLTTGNTYNTFMGGCAGAQTSTGAGNVYLGYYAGALPQTAANNVVIGYEAGRGAAASTYASSVIVGYGAGYALTTGNNNILLGYQAGNTLTTGGSNILIGYDVDTAAVDTASFLSIGNLIFATGGFGTGTAVGAGFVGIKNASPTEALDVTGNIAVSGTVDGVDVAGFNAMQFVTLAASGFAANERVLTGTANQVVITDNGAGSTVVLSTPQNIHSAATPTFGGLTINGNITVTGTVDGIDVGNFGAVQFVTLAADAAIANERVLTGTANQVVITDNGAGSTVVLSTPQDIHTAATPTFGGVVIANGGTVGQAAGPLLTFDDTNNYLEITGAKVGIGVTDPDTQLEVLYAGTQLKLSYDGGDNATFAVNTSGYLSITPSGNWTVFYGGISVDTNDVNFAAPVMSLTQSDVSEEFFGFSTTIGVGNAIEAVAAKTMTTTHFIKVTLPGSLTRYLPVGTIAEQGGEIFSADVRIGGGLYVGGTGTDPDADWIYADGGIYVNETANASQAIGLTVNQGANDDEILALKSTDVEHSFTGAGMSETDTFGVFRKGQNTSGGLQIAGYKDADGAAGLALLLRGRLDENANTTKTTSGTAIVAVYASITDGANGETNVNADGNLFSIRDYDATRFIFDAEGSAHADVEWVAFDEQDDVGLLGTLEDTLTAWADPVKAEFASFLEDGRDVLESLGIVHFDDGNPGHAMVNFTRLSMLLVGAIRQQAARLDAYEGRLLTA